MDMLCCFPIPRSGVRTLSPILDLEQLVHDHCWAEFKASLGRVQRACVSRRDYSIHVPMQLFLVTQYKEPKVKARVRQGDLSTAHALVRQANRDRSNQDEKKDSGNDRKDEKKMKKKKKKKEQMLRDDGSSKLEMVTEFTNATEVQQTYKFRVEKTRTSSLSLTVQRGFSIGGKTSVRLGLPHLGGGAGLDCRLHLTKAEGDTVTETLALEATSDIHVEARTRCVARVFLTETQVEYDFTAWTRVTLPVDGVPMTIRRKRDNRVCYSAMLVLVTDIFDPLDEFNVKVKTEEVPSSHRAGEVIVKPYVVLQTDGVIQGVRLADQEIRLEASALPVPAQSNTQAGGDAGGGDVPQATATTTTGANGTASKVPEGETLLKGLDNPTNPDDAADKDKDNDSGDNDDDDDDDDSDDDTEDDSASDDEAEVPASGLSKHGPPHEHTGSEGKQPMNCSNDVKASLLASPEYCSKLWHGDGGDALKTMTTV